MSDIHALSGAYATDALDGIDRHARFQLERRSRLEMDNPDHF